MFLYETGSQGNCPLSGLLIAKGSSWSGWPLLETTAAGAMSPAGRSEPPNGTALSCQTMSLVETTFLGSTTVAGLRSVSTVSPEKTSFTGTLLQLLT